MKDGAESESNAGVLASLQAAFTRNVHLKLIALLLTVALYLWVGADTVTRVVAVPFQISVPSDQVLLEPKLDTVKVTLEGRSSSLDRYQEKAEKDVTLELSKAEDGQMLAIPHRAVDPPAGLRVVKIEPSFIRVEMAEKRKKEVPIRPRIAGTQDPSYTVGKVTADPETVVAQGPRSVIEKLDAIPTEPIDVSERDESFSTEVQLRPKSSMIRYELDQPVEVSVAIEVKELQRTLEDVKVRPVNTSYAAQVAPGTIEVSVRGPQSSVEALEASELFAVVDLSGEQYEDPGTFEMGLEVRSLPSDVEVVATRPEQVVVTTRRRPGASGGGSDDAGGGDSGPD